jgi:ATP-binding cassette, subfamily B, bacterial CvaB/MchF/RaxB
VISLLDLGLCLTRRVPLVLQTELAECGLACLAMVTGYFGLDTDLMALRRRFTSPTRGTGLDEIARCADALGLTCRAVRVDLVDIGALKTPAILRADLNGSIMMRYRDGSRALHLNSRLLQDFNEVIIDIASKLANYGVPLTG